MSDGFITEVFNADGSETLEYRAKRAAASLTYSGEYALSQRDWEALEEYARVKILDGVAPF